MAAEEVYQRILGYLKKEGPLNTFRLAGNLNLERYKLLDFIKKLEKAGAVEVRHGMVKFLKFPPEEKRIKRRESKPKTERTESKIKEAEPKVKPPKVIRRTIFKRVPVIKKVYVKSKRLEEQAEQIAKLENTIKELKKKAAPKVITKTIIKRVPLVRTVIKRIPVTRTASTRTASKEIPAPSLLPKFRLPQFTFMKNIKQLKRPEFVEK